jgi:hypothetical protein
MEDSQRAFELLQAGDADGLRRLLEQAPTAARVGTAALGRPGRAKLGSRR